jgi:DNA repair protein RadC
MGADVNVTALAEGELIARVIGGGRPRPAARELGVRLARVPAWERRALGEAGLAREYGLSLDRAARLAAVWELAERWQPDERPAVVSPRDAVLLLERLRTRRTEEVVVIMLDARQRPLSIESVAVGSVNASRLQPRDVFATALRSEAVYVILGHNHPSGDPSPSRADRLVTAQLRAAGELLGVAVLDHVILARRGHHSFRDTENWDGDAAA